MNLEALAQWNQVSRLGNSDILIRVLINSKSDKYFDKQTVTYARKG